MAGVTLSELVSGLRTINVPFGEHVLRVTYRLSERTPEANGRMNVLAPATELIGQLVASWDLTDDSGSMIPLDEEHLAGVPVPLLRRIIAAIIGDDGLGEVASSSDAS